MVGGWPGTDMEFVDISGQRRTCDKPSDYPNSAATEGQKGAFFDGSPLMCGGISFALEEPAITDLCHRYDHEVSAQSW